MSGLGYSLSRVGGQFLRERAVPSDQRIRKSLSGISVFKAVKYVAEIPD